MKWIERRMVLSLAFGAMAFGPASWAADRNTERFLPNSDFSKGAETPEFWRVNDAKKITVKRDTGEFRSGPSSLLVEVNGAGEGDALTQIWKAIPSGAFTVSGWVKASGTFTKAQVALQSLAEGWGGKDFISLHDVKPGGDWVRFSKEVTLDKDAKFGLLHVIANGTGQIRLDDITIETQDAPKINAAADARAVGTQPSKYLRAAPLAWKQVNIGGGGTVTALAVASNPPSIWAAADVAGPMKRDLRAGRWSHMTDFFGPDNTALMHAETIAIDPKNSNVVLYSGGKQWNEGIPGILRTQDGGKTWSHASLPGADGKPAFVTNGRTGKRLTFDPNDSNIVWYGSRRDGLFKSVDGGRSWSAVPNFPTTGHAQKNVRVEFVVISPTQPREMWARVAAEGEDKAVATGIYRSLDGGSTWRKVEDVPAAGYGVFDARGRFFLSGKGVFRWDEATQKFVDISPKADQIGGKNLFALAISPADPNIIVTAQDHCGGSNGVLRTLDGGATWTRFGDDDLGERGKKTVRAEIQPWEGGNNGVHIFGCASSLAFDPINPKKVWLSHWPGIISCRDITEPVLHWRAEHEGHEEVCLFDLASPSAGVPLVSGMMDVGGFAHHSLDEMPRSQMVGIQIPPWNMAPEDVSSIDFCESQPGFIAIAGGWKYNQSGQGGFSANGGKTWRNFGSMPFKDASNGRIAVAANDPKSMVWIPRDRLAGVDKGGTPAYFTRDGGETWAPAKGAPLGMIYGEFVYTFYMPLTSDRVRPSTFYLYDRRDGRFYRSQDGGENWAHTATLPAQPGAHFDQHNVKAAPGVGGEVWVAADRQGLLRSSDGGEAWKKITGVERAWRFGWGKGSGRNPVAYLLGKVAGDDIKQAVALYRSEDMGATWARLNGPEQGWAHATVVTGDRQVVNRVYVGTNGRGIFYGVPSVATPGPRRQVARR